MLFRSMDELNGKLIACQILITGLIARVANEQRDPLHFLTDFRDEIKAVVNGVNIAGMDLGRKREGGQALMVLLLDDPVSPELLDRIGRIEGMETARIVTLP